jgi:hypothetical protein
VAQDQEPKQTNLLHQAHAFRMRLAQRPDTAIREALQMAGAYGMNTGPNQTQVVENAQVQKQQYHHHAVEHADEFGSGDTIGQFELSLEEIRFYSAYFNESQ